MKVEVKEKLVYFIQNYLDALTGFYWMIRDETFACFRWQFDHVVFMFQQTVYLKLQRDFKLAFCFILNNILQGQREVL